MRKVYALIVKDFYEALPAILFFFVAFSLVDITAILLHKTITEASSRFGVIAISALVMGKVVVISNHLPFIDLFYGKPLIWSTIWKTFIYVICGFFVRILERALPLLFEGENWSMIYDKLVKDANHLEFWVAQMWLTVLFLIFVASNELIQQVGKDKVRQMFFGK